MGSSISHVWWVLLKVFVIKVAGVNVEVSREAPLSVQRNIVQRCSKLLSPWIFQCLAQISSRKEPGYGPVSYQHQALGTTHDVPHQPWPRHKHQTAMGPQIMNGSNTFHRPSVWGEYKFWSREGIHAIINIYIYVCIYIHTVYIYTVYIYISNDKHSNPIWPFFFPSPNINHPIHRCLTPDFGFKNLSLFIFKRKPPKRDRTGSIYA